MKLKQLFNSYFFNVWAGNGSNTEINTIEKNTEGKKPEKFTEINTEKNSVFLYMDIFIHGHS